MFEHYRLCCLFLFWLYCTYHLVPWILLMSICYVCGFHNAHETREALANFFRDLINDKLNEYGKK